MKKMLILFVLVALFVSLVPISIPSAGRPDHSNKGEIRGINETTKSIRVYEPYITCK